LILTVEHGVKVTKFYYIIFDFYSYYIVQFLTQSFKPFRIFRKIKYMTFNLTLYLEIKVMEKRFFLVFGVFGQNLNKIGLVISEKNVLQQQQQEPVQS